MGHLNDSIEECDRYEFQLNVIQLFWVQTTVEHFFPIIELLLHTQQTMCNEIRVWR